MLSTWWLIITGLYLALGLTTWENGFFFVTIPFFATLYIILMHHSLKPWRQTKSKAFRIWVYTLASILYLAPMVPFVYVIVVDSKFLLYIFLGMLLSHY